MSIKSYIRALLFAGKCSKIQINIANSSVFVFDLHREKRNISLSLYMKKRIAVLTRCAFSLCILFLFKSLGDG